MIAVDTNILVRLFVKDNNSEQIDLVQSLLKNQDKIYISQLVQIELVWVLESAYQFNKTQVTLILDTLTNHAVFCLENAHQFNHALTLFKNNNADFSDYLIFANAFDNHLDFWTFDKKLAKADGIHHLSKYTII